MPSLFGQVSVHVSRSNYTQQRAPHGESVVVSFTQPPTITHTAPPVLPFDISADFAYILETTSVLGRQLSFGEIQSSPPELSANVSVTIFEHNVGARVMGRVSIQWTLPLILQLEEPPSLSVAVSNDVGGVVIARTELRINPSPPLFERSEYVFNLAEGTSTGELLGPIRLIDPNRGDNILVPTIISSENGTIPRFFDVIPTLPALESDSDDVYKSFYLVARFQFDYEVIEVVRFRLLSEDHHDPSLTSVAMVTVNIMPVNDFTPTFIVNRFEIVNFQIKHIMFIFL